MFPILNIFKYASIQLNKKSVIPNSLLENSYLIIMLLIVDRMSESLKFLVSNKSGLFLEYSLQYYLLENILLDIFITTLFYKLIYFLNYKMRAQIILIQYDVQSLSTSTTSYTNYIFKIILSIKSVLFLI